MNEANETKIARLEERVAELHSDVSLILNNHLPHIQSSLNKINTKLAMWSGGLILAMWLLEHYAK